MGVIDSSGNTKFLEFENSNNFYERTWNQSGGTRGNINYGITGTYDGSGNIRLFTPISNSIPGYGSFGNWGGRLIWTKDVTSRSATHTFPSPNILTLNNGLPTGFTFTFFQSHGPVSPTNEGYFSWLPNT
jgi:hypothetical protein